MMPDERIVLIDPCNDFDCHIEVIPAEYCTIPVKGHFDANCWIPCLIANCSTKIEAGNSCYDFICHPKISETTTQPSKVSFTSPPISISSTTTSPPISISSTTTSPPISISSTTVASSPPTTFNPKTLSTTTSDQPTAFNPETNSKKLNLTSDPCDDYDCHVETVPTDFCFLPVRGPYDIDCFPPCKIDNCTKQYQPGSTCLDYLCIPKINPIPPTPPPPPPPPNPTPVPPGPGPDRDAVLIGSTLGKYNF